MNKFIGKVVGLVLLLVAMILPVNADYTNYTHSSLYNWNIPSFEVDLKLQENGDLYVRETIVADFSNYARRGIVRDIPYKYGYLWDAVTTPIEVISVVNEKGRSWRYKTEKSGGVLYIEIGDDTFINEKVTYVIEYKVENALIFLKSGVSYGDKSQNFKEEIDRVDLYWNAISTYWSESPIENYKVTVDLSSFPSSAILATQCFIGAASSEDKCEYVQNDGKFVVSGDRLGFQRGITVGFLMDASVITQDFMTGYIWRSIMKFLLLLYPFVAFLGFFIYWYKNGRNPEKRVIVPYFKLDEDLSPMEIGTLVDKKFDTRDITAGIIDLSLRGYIQIVEEKTESIIGLSKTNLKFVKLKEFKDDDSLLSFEKNILDGLFKNNRSEVKISQLVGHFYASVSLAKNNIFQHLTTEGYYVKNPEAQQAEFVAFGFISGFCAVWVGLVFQWFVLIYLVLPLSVFALIFSFFMGPKTEAGMRLYEKILGFKDFIKVANKDRLEFFQSLNDKNDRNEGVKTFEKLLPYAMSLGLADKWSGLFGDFLGENYNPSWYRSGSESFNIAQFGRSLNRINTGMVSASRAPSSSGSGGSGGGRVGGGRGGGGGRSR